MYLCVRLRKVAQLVAHYVRDVGVGRSSRLFPTSTEQMFTISQKSQSDLYESTDFFLLVSSSKAIGKKGSAIAPTERYASLPLRLHTDILHGKMLNLSLITIRVLSSQRDIVEHEI